MDLNELQGILSTLKTPGALSDMADVNQMVQTGNGDARRQALGSGMLGLASGLMSSPSNTMGLSKGIDNFNRAYDTELISNRPKVTPLADGAFSQITFPDGTVQIVGNKDVAKFLEAKYGTQAANKLVNTVVGAQAGVDAADAKDRNKRNLDVAGGPQASQEFSPQVTDSIAKLDRLEKWITSGQADKVGYGEYKTDMPVVANAIDNTVGRFFGTDDATNRQDLDTFLGKSVLDQAAMMKGALSDKDVAFLKDMNVKATDTPSRKAEYIREFKARLIKGEQERMAAAKAANTGGGSSAPQVSQEFLNMYNNLKPGEKYTGPDGQQRTKR